MHVHCVYYSSEYCVYYSSEYIIATSSTHSKLSVHDNNGNANSSSDSAAHFLLLPQVLTLPHEY